jgi:hypothetical protein
MTMSTQHAIAEPGSTPGAFASDQAFLKKHTDVILLTKGSSAVAVVPAYQGRVMTSTFDRENGPSFGWINRPAIEKGFLADEEEKGKLEEHIHIFGNEERFWPGPEGGQFAIFFKPGNKIRMVAYETDNRITNRGDQAWTPEKCLLSIWMLGMYTPSPKTTVVIPIEAGDESELGPKVNDTYFGKVPADHLKVEDERRLTRARSSTTRPILRTRNLLSRRPQAR